VFQFGWQQLAMQLPVEFLSAAELRGPLFEPAKAMA
jgi:hypothetical protein